MTNLFRKEVLEKKSDSIFGDVRLISPLSQNLWFSFIAFIFLGIIAFLVLGEYNRKVKVDGVISSRNAIYRISSGVEGIVDTIYFSEGESVGKNAALMKISKVEYFGNELSNLSLIKKEYQNKKKILDINYKSEDRSLKETLVRLKDKCRYLSEREIALKEKKSQLISIISRYSKTLLKYKTNKKYIPKFTIENLESRLDTVSNQKIDVSISLLDVRRDFNECKLDIENTKIQITELAEVYDYDITSNLNDYKSRVGKLSYIVRANSNGIVANIEPSVGDSISKGANLFSITEKSGNFQATLNVPSRGISSAKLGAIVNIRLSAFPVVQYGPVRGRIVQVAELVQDQNDSGSYNSSNTQGETYQVIVDLDKSDIMKLGGPDALKLGMSVNADIILPAQKLYELVFSKIFFEESKV